MLILVEIDLSKADIALFEEYESEALGLLANHGAHLIERLRSADNQREVHLLSFPDNDALVSFGADPTRVQLQGTWLRCGAMTNLTEVKRLGPD